MAAKPPTGFLSNLRRAFRERFVIGDQYKPYLPPTPQSTAEGAKDDHPVYRYPAPASQEVADVPIRYPETVYDTQFHKRSSIKLTPPPGADEHEFRTLAQPGQYPGDYPRHAPHPWWYYDMDVMEGKWKMWKDSGGLVAAGAWREQKALKRVGPDPY